MIRKEVATPLSCHGYALFDDGTLVVFRAAADEPTRVHPHAGLADAVRLGRLRRRAPGRHRPAGADRQRRAGAGHLRLPVGGPDGRRDGADEPRSFEALVAAAPGSADHYHWLGDADRRPARRRSRDVRATAEQVLDEFEKVRAAHQRRPPTRWRPPRPRSPRSSGGARRAARSTPQGWVDRLTELRTAAGRIWSPCASCATSTPPGSTRSTRSWRPSWAAPRSARSAFLPGDDAFAGYHADVERLVADAGAIATVAEAAPIGERLGAAGAGPGDRDRGGRHARHRRRHRADRRSWNGSARCSAAVNRARATLEARRGELLAGEGRAAFAAEYALLGQASPARWRCPTPPSAATSSWAA